MSSYDLIFKLSISYKVVVMSMFNVFYNLLANYNICISEKYTLF